MPGGVRWLRGAVRCCGPSVWRLTREICAAVNGIFASMKNDLAGRIDEKVALARRSRLGWPAARTPKRTRVPDLQSETLSPIGHRACADSAWVGAVGQVYLRRQSMIEHPAPADGALQRLPDAVHDLSTLLSRPNVLRPGVPCATAQKADAAGACTTPTIGRRPRGSS